MKHDKLPILFLVLGAVAAGVIAGGGPLLWALLVMGVPFILLFVVLGGVAHGHVDNGHFRPAGSKPRPRL